MSLMPQSVSDEPDEPELLAALVAQVQDYAIFVLDPTGHVVTWNAGAGRFKGYAAQEIIGRHFSAFYPEEDVTAGKPAWELEVAEREGRLEDEGWRVRKDGTRFWANVVITALRGEDGSLKGFGKVTRDLTDRRAVELEIRESEERLRLMVEAVQDYAILMLDPTGHVITWNAGAQRFKGYAAPEILGQHFSAFYLKEDVDAGKPAWELEVAEREGRLEDEGWRIRKDGTRFWANVVITALRGEQGELRGFGKVTRDLTERREAELALARAEQRFRRAFHDAPIGLVITSVEEGHIGRILDVNRVLCVLTGYERDDLLGRESQSLTHLADRENEEQTLADLIAGRTQAHQGERRLLRRDGSVVVAEVGVSLVRDDDGLALHLITQVADISARKRYESQLRHMAQHDPLTGLLNRSRFNDALDAHLARVRRHGPTGAVLMVDLDKFKEVNDRLGHAAGDQVLVSAARILQGRVRDTDVLARLGGDEFAIIMTDGGEPEAQVLAGDLSDLVRRRSVILDTEIGGVTASIGIAVVDGRDMLTSADLLGEADEAMYTAKREGRNRISALVTEEGAARQRTARLTLHHQIDSAILDDRFELELQPVLDLTTGTVRAYEALVRMIDEDGTRVQPGRFLYVAERFDQIHAIDHWVVAHAAALLHRMQPEQAIEINISGRSLGRPDLAARIGQVIVEQQLDPSRLIFEITETAAIGNMQRAREFAQELTSLGCRFALDDFGAGFGSFYYLKHLPFDYLKIDGEFVTSALSNRTDQLIIRSCVDLARGLGKKTIAEFVENDELLGLVTSLGVDHAQGYTIARPMPIDQALGKA